jgi:hypothetical protein
VVSLAKSDSNIHFGVLGILPFDGSLDRFNNLSINKYGTTVTEISRGEELDHGAVIGNWELGSVVITNIGFGLGLADSLVADFGHVSHDLFAMASSGLFVEGSLEGLQVESTFVRNGLGENRAVREWEGDCFDTVMAMFFWIHGGFGWLDRTGFPDFIEVSLGEVHPFAIVNLELPPGGTVTAAFGTFDLENVHSAVKGHTEIKSGRFTILPNIFLILLHDFSVHEGHASESKVGWDSKFPGKFVSADWEHDTVVETDISVLASSTNSTVRELAHTSELFVLAIAFGGLGGLDGLIESGDVRDHAGFGFPIESLGIEFTAFQGFGSFSGCSSGGCGGGSVGHGSSTSWDTAGTDLVAPFLVAAHIFGGLSSMFRIKYTFAS